MDVQREEIIELKKKQLKEETKAFASGVCVGVVAGASFATMFTLLIGGFVWILFK